MNPQVNVISENLVLCLQHTHGPRPFSLTLNSVPSGTSVTLDLMTVSGFS